MSVPGSHPAQSLTEHLSLGLPICKMGIIIKTNNHWAPACRWAASVIPFNAHHCLQPGRHQGSLEICCQEKAEAQEGPGVCLLPAAPRHEGVSHGAMGLPLRQGLHPSLLLLSLPPALCPLPFWEQPRVVQWDHFNPHFTNGDPKVQSRGVTSPGGVKRAWM